MPTAALNGELRISSLACGSVVVVAVDDGHARAVAACVTLAGVISLSVVCDNARSRAGFTRVLEARQLSTERREQTPLKPNRPRAP